MMNMSKPTIADVEAALDQKADVEILPNGEVRIGREYPHEVRIPFLNEFTKQCKIFASDDSPNKGGGRHHYRVVCFTADGEVDYENSIDFQEGAPTTVGHNGLFSVALLALVIDHLKSFQEGEFATRQGACAITNVEQAIHWLCARADERQARGVLGEHKK
jgi:hypothetical protein